MYDVFRVKGLLNPSLKISALLLFHGYDFESNIFSSLAIIVNAQWKSDKLKAEVFVAMTTIGV